MDSCRGSAQLLRPILSFSLAFVLVLAMSGSAAAHRPLFSGNRGAHPDAAVRIPDSSVSHVLYSELTTEAPYFWFVFDHEQPGPIPFQLGAPAGSGWERTDPVVVLMHHESSEPPDPQAVVASPSESGGAIVIRNLHEAQLFEEPVTGTTSWILAETEVRLPAAGTYYGVLHEQSGRGGKFWVAVGEREKFSGRDIWRLPGLIRDVRRFHEVSGWPPWMWIAGCVLVATPVGIGWSARRIRQHLS